jgi:hypothetical protein
MSGWSPAGEAELSAEKYGGEVRLVFRVHEEREAAALRESLAELGATSSSCNFIL